MNTVAGKETQVASLKKEFKKRSEFFPVILEYLQNHGPKPKGDIEQYLVDSFKIRRELMDVPKKDGSSLYENRMAWALFDLHKAGLIRIVERGIYAITEYGGKSRDFDFKWLKNEVNGRLADIYKRNR